MRRAWTLFVLASCWRAPETQPVETLPAPMLEPAPPAVPARSVWEGFYECAQGQTAVTLTIAASPTGSAKAMFEFGPHEGNPGIPSGKYRLTGTFRERDDGRLELKLQPQRWIEQPSGYTMTGLAARSDDRRRQLAGMILSPTCGEITVERKR